MAKISYSFAVSLDGFIARNNGDVDWLTPYFGPMDSPYEHENYYKSVTAVIMGRKTYEKALSFGAYPYKGKPGLVVTRNSDYKITEPGVEPITNHLSSQISNLKKSTEGTIWLVGGGELATHFLENSLLDELVLSVIPVTIGTGIRWIGTTDLQNAWALVGHYTSDKGIVQLVYSRKDG
jgi:dihydrofolate reductase